MNSFILELGEPEKMVSVVGVLCLPCALELVLLLPFPCLFQFYVQEFIDTDCTLVKYVFETSLCAIKLFLKGFSSASPGLLQLDASPPDFAFELHTSILSSAISGFLLHAGPLTPEHLRPFKQCIELCLLGSDHIFDFFIFCGTRHVLLRRVLKAACKERDFAKELVFHVRKNLADVLIQVSD